MGKRTTIFVSLGLVLLVATVLLLALVAQVSLVARQCRRQGRRVDGGLGAPPPLVVALHGGWWRAAHDRSHLGHLRRALRDEGFAVVNLEYRRLGMKGGGLPGMCADVLAGVAEARRLAGPLPIRETPPVLLGHSAGGQLALWVAKEAPSRGVVALAPVTDLDLTASLGLGGGVVDEFLASAWALREETIARASPVRRRSENATRSVARGPASSGRTR